MLKRFCKHPLRRSNQSLGNTLMVQRIRLVRSKLSCVLQDLFFRTFVTGIFKHVKLGESGEMTARAPITSPAALQLQPLRLLHVHSHLPSGYLETSLRGYNISPMSTKFLFFLIFVWLHLVLVVARDLVC